MQDIIAFVEAVSQPNGRSEGSYGPTNYFLARFTTVQMPKKSVANYKETLNCSVVGTFNQCQREAGPQTDFENIVLRCLYVRIN